MCIYSSDSVVNQILCHGKTYIEIPKDEEVERQDSSSEGRGVDPVLKVGGTGDQFIYTYMYV